MAADPKLLAQVEQLERENRLLDERLDAKRKAAAEASPRNPAQRFVDNLVDAISRNPSVASARDAYTNPGRAILSMVQPMAVPGSPIHGRNPDIFDAFGVLGQGMRAGAGFAGMLNPERSQQVAADERTRRETFEATSKADPFYKAPGGLQAKAVAAVSTLGGQLAGSLTDPANLVNPEGSVARKIVGQGAMNAGLDVVGQASDKAAGIRDHIDPLEVVANAVVGSGISATHEGGKAFVNTIGGRLLKDGGKPPLSHLEEPPAPPAPRDVPAAPESAAHVPPPEPKEAPKPSAGSNPADTPKKPAGDSPGGSGEGAEAGDPWKFVDWGKMRSKERSAAAVEHLDFLKKYIKPESVKDFVNALDRPEVDGQLGGGDRVGPINPKYVDWEKLDASPEDILQWTNIRAGLFKDLYAKAGDEARTWGEIDATSKLMGKDLSTLIKTHADITGEGGIAARVGALQQVTLEAADAFHAQLKDTRKAIEAGDMSGVASFAAATQRLVLLEAMAEGSVSEVARALNYMKRLKTPKAAVNDLQSTLDTFADAMNGGRPVDPNALKNVMDNLDNAFKKRGAAGVRSEVAKMRELGLTDYIGYVVIGGLLSSPKTWLRNLVGTPIMSTFQVAERYIGAGVGAARSAAGFGSKERMTFGEANAYLASAMDGLHDGFVKGLKAFQTGAADSGSSIIGEGAVRPIPFQLTKERVNRWKTDGFSFKTVADIAGTTFYEVVRTMGYRFSVASDEFYKAVTHRQQLGGLAYREAHFRASAAAAQAAPPPPPAEGMVRMYHGGDPAPDHSGPLWFAATEDYARNYRGGPNKVWYVDVPEATLYPDGGPEMGFAPLHNIELPASVAGQRKLLAGKGDKNVYDKVFKDTLEGIRQEPTAQVFKEAKGWFLERDMDPDAVYPTGTKEEELALLVRSVDLEKMAADHMRLVTFQRTGPAIHKWEQAFATVPLLKWFYVPFFKTPINLVKAGIIDRNPVTLGLLGENRQAFSRLIETAKSDEAALERGGAEADLAAARLMTGGAFMSFAFMLWANGNLVGRRGEPGDPTKQDGILDYSLKLPNGEWVQYSSLDPILGSNLGLVADLAQTLKERELDDNVALAAVGGVFAAVRNNILNKAAFAGLKDFYETYYGKGSNSDAAGGKSLMEGLYGSAESLVPFSSLLRSTAQDLDPVRRDAHGFLAHIQAMTPKWSEVLPARRDAFGRLLVRKPGERGVAQAFNTSEETDDPLDLEQSRLAKNLLDFTLKPAQRRFNNQPVSDKEYSRVLEVQGQLYRDKRTGLNMEEAAVELIASPEYGEWSDAMRAYELKDLVTKYREEANAEIRDSRSEFYMDEMVRRTAKAQLTTEVPQKGLHGGKLRKRARTLGMPAEDLQALENILQP